ncbi:MAG: substrate-binding domain-containing protein [Anaerolineae bacterium]|nr:substrate-binding domain-containing protein [Anaerolineae bacterium]
MPTIKDVAKRAGVSPMTVSRVLNDASNVRPSTREKVLAAVEELGYVPSGVAKSLRSKRTHTLALLVPDGANAFWTTVARGVEDAAQDRGYSVLLCNTDENPAKQQNYLDVVIRQQVDGVVIAPCDTDAQNLDKLRRTGVPTVVIDRYIKSWDVDTVIGDSIGGARALVRHLISLGHQRIAMLSGPATTSTASDRVVGYRIALAEAGLPYDPRLVKEGEYRALSGERLTQQLLGEGLAPTAIFAANNALLLGAIVALEKRGLRVPQDIAMVCFGDLPNTAHFFPFLTVADFPSYEMGVNAAQILFSRVEAEVDLKRRCVVLPSRMIVRHSCGSKMDGDGKSTFRLSAPIPSEDERQILIKPLSPEEVSELSEYLAGIPSEILQVEEQPSPFEKSDVGRLLTVLQHQEADRIPHLELGIASKAVYEYVLEREVETNSGRAGLGGLAVSPVDRVEFAQRLGMDAVVCCLAWQPEGELEGAPGWVKTWSDLEKLESPRSLASQLGCLEGHLRAAQGTGVGVVVSLPSFFSGALQALGIGDLGSCRQDRPLLEAAIDTLLDYWKRMMWAVCDRFAGDLAFVQVDEDLSAVEGDIELFMEIYPGRMRRLIAPAKQHGKLVALHTGGKLNKLLPMVRQIGFEILYPSQLDAGAALEIKEAWGGQLALIGELPAPLLADAGREEIEAQVREICRRLASGGGYAIGSSSAITDTVPPESFVAMTRAVHRYGRYGSLGSTVPGR